MVWTNSILKRWFDNLNDELVTLYNNKPTLTQFKYVYSAGSYPTVQKQ